MRAFALVCALVSLMVAGSVALSGDAPSQGADQKKAAGLIKQLGHDDFSKREAASKALADIGEPALDALKQAMTSEDPEVRARAGKLIATLMDRLAHSDVKSVPPPKDAIVLFDGKDLDRWLDRAGAAQPAWKMLAGGVMEAHANDIYTIQCFGKSYRLHVEFRVPPNPANTPHGAGNSGVYLHGRYEVQILDSYGVPAHAAQLIHSAPSESCGAIYGHIAPRVNACKAPGFWQSYDIEFHPPQYTNGVKKEHPRATVFHNGTKIHDDVAINTDDTGMGLPGDPAEPGPVLLQYHGSPVQFRNIWLLPSVKG